MHFFGISFRCSWADFRVDTGVILFTQPNKSRLRLSLGAEVYDKLVTGPNTLSNFECTKQFWHKRLQDVHDDDHDFDHVIQHVMDFNIILLRQ